MRVDCVLFYAGVHFHVLRHPLMKLSHPRPSSTRMTDPTNKQHPRHAAGGRAG